MYHIRAVGDTTPSSELWPISATEFPIKRWATSCAATGSSRHRGHGNDELGRTFSLVTRCNEDCQSHRKKFQAIDSAASWISVYASRVVCAGATRRKVASIRTAVDTGRRPARWSLAGKPRGGQLRGAPGTIGQIHPISYRFQVAKAAKDATVARAPWPILADGPHACGQRIKRLGRLLPEMTARISDLQPQIGLR